MWKRDQNGVRPMERLTHNMLLLTFFSGLIIFQALPSDKTVAATTGPDAGGQILTKQQGGPFDQCWMTDSVVKFEVETI